MVLQDRPSLFGGKSHALLCHTYTKGRDWHDFLWYVRNQVGVNFQFLSNALHQVGPWKGKGIQVDKAWHPKQMAEKIKHTDWKAAAQDVQRFLKPQELKGLEVWGKDFFLDRLAKLGEIL